MSTIGSPDISAGRRILILISGVLTVALYFTSILVASTVLPQMQGTFAATPDEISWAITFNILATAIAMPMTGWPVARFGRRHIMIWSTTIFTLSTMLCGTASSLEELIVWRIVQGAAGAPSVPLVQTILLDTFPQRQHRAVLGIYGMGVVLGPMQALHWADISPRASTGAGLFSFWSQSAPWRHSGSEHPWCVTTALPIPSASAGSVSCSSRRPSAGCN